MNPCRKCGQFIKCECPERPGQMAEEEKKRSENDAAEEQFKAFAIGMIPKLQAFADAQIENAKREWAPDLEAIWVQFYRSAIGTMDPVSVADAGILAFESRAPDLARRSRLLAAKLAETEEHDRRPTDPPRPVAVGLGRAKGNLQ